MLQEDIVKDIYNQLGLEYSINSVKYDDDGYVIYLDLSWNSLTNLSEGIFDNLTQIQSLYLHNNSLAKLPNGVFDKLTQLRRLSLINNRLPDYLNKIFEGNEITNTLLKLNIESEKGKKIEIKKQEELKRKAEFEEQNRITSLVTNIMKIVQKITPNIPVQLSRIADLSNGGLTEVEDLLKTLLSNNNELGEYLEFEQVFIRKEMEITDDLIISSSPMVAASKISDALQICTKCRETQSTLIRECTNCKESLPYCNICKRGFSKTDVKLTCPHCENAYHRNHLYAYIQSQGKCAVCKENLTLGQFE